MALKKILGLRCLVKRAPDLFTSDDTAKDTRGRLGEWSSLYAYHQ